MADFNGSEPEAPPQAVPERAWSLNLLSVAGIPIRIHFTFLLLLVWIMFGGFGPSPKFALLYVIGVFTSVLLHELGHSLLAQRMGIKVRDIVLYPIGGVSSMERLPEPAKELPITLAGPLVNLVIAALIYVGLAMTGTLVPLTEFFRNIGVATGHFWQSMLVANLILFVFNILPAFPMDGGRILRAFLALRIGEVRATEIAATIGQLMAFAFGIWGLLQPNYILLFIAFFVYIGAGQEATIYRRKALVEGLLARAAMITDFKTLSVGATLREAADLLLQTSQHDFPVMNGDEVVGVLSRQALLRGFYEHGETSYVAASMQRDYLRVAPDSDLQEIVTEMQTGQIPCVLVMQDNTLLGIITMENLAELLVVRELRQRAQQARA